MLLLLRMVHQTNANSLVNVQRKVAEHSFQVLRESSFSMTRGDEDIEGGGGGLRKFFSLFQAEIIAGTEQIK